MGAGPPPQKPQIAEEVHCVAVALLVADGWSGRAGSRRTRGPDQPAAARVEERHLFAGLVRRPAGRETPAAAGSCRRPCATPAG